MGNNLKQWDMFSESCRRCSNNGLIWECLKCFIVQRIFETVVLLPLTEKVLLQKEKNKSQNQNQNDVDADARNAKRTRALRWFVWGNSWTWGGSRSRSTFVRANPNWTLNKMMNFRHAVIKWTGVVANSCLRCINVQSTRLQKTKFELTNRGSTIAIGVSLISGLAFRNAKAERKTFFTL